MNELSVDIALSSPIAVVDTWSPRGSSRLAVCGRSASDVSNHPTLDLGY